MIIEKNKLNEIRNSIDPNKKKIVKFLIVGSLSFIVNVGIYYIYFLIYYLFKVISGDISIDFEINNILNTDSLKILASSFKEFVGTKRIHKDISNVIAVEISVLYNFYMSRRWTWNHIEKRKGKKLFYQGLKFHLAVLPGMLFRFLSFPFFNHIFKMHDMLNIIIGVIIAMIFNFIGYDKIVFKKKK